MAPLRRLPDPCILVVQFVALPAPGHLREELQVRTHFGEEGQGFVEYGWTIVLVGVLVMVIVIILGGTILGLWEQAWEALRGAFAPEPESEALLQSIRYAMLHLGQLL